MLLPIRSPVLLHLCVLVVARDPALARAPEAHVLRSSAPSNLDAQQGKPPGPQKSLQMTEGQLKEKVVEEISFRKEKVSELMQHFSFANKLPTMSAILAYRIPNLVLILVSATSLLIALGCTWYSLNKTKTTERRAEGGGSDARFPRSGGPHRSYRRYRNIRETHRRSFGTASDSDRSRSGSASASVRSRVFEIDSSDEDIASSGSEISELSPAPSVAASQRTSSTGRRRSKNIDHDSSDDESAEEPEELEEPISLSPTPPVAASQRTSLYVKGQ